MSSDEKTTTTTTTTPSASPKTSSTTTDVNSTGGPDLGFSEAQQVICSVIPSLGEGRHKGQAGRVGVVGGSKEYTGAPYFSAISALKAGADLAYVFCSADSAPVIKSYSPELIVLPSLDQGNALEEMAPFLPRLHSLVIGPGLGRSDAVLGTVGALLGGLKEAQTPVVLDADALHFVAQCPEIVRGYRQAVLTPNAVEFDGLYTAVFRTARKTTSSTSSSSSSPADFEAVVQELAARLDGVTILRKGPVDIVSDGRHTFTCSEAGSPRRCGGQGDLLSGSLGLFSHWSHDALRGSLENAHQNKVDGATSSSSSSPTIYQRYSPTIIAALAASMLTRRCARLAFAKNGRSTTTTNLITEIREAFSGLFPVD